MEIRTEFPTRPELFHFVIAMLIKNTQYFISSPADSDIQLTVY